MGVVKATWLMLGLTCWGTARAGESGPIAIPTFHCMGLYWSPGGGSADKKVLVRYRERGTSAWQEALAMKYNPIPGTDEDLADYRGSVVDLKPGTTYEFHLELAGTPIRADVTAIASSGTSRRATTSCARARPTTSAPAIAGTIQTTISTTISSTVRCPPIRRRMASAARHPCASASMRANSEGHSTDVPCSETCERGEI